MSLKMLVFSDLHLLSKTVPTEFLISNLNKSLPDSSRLADVDIIWLAGDVFDNIGNFSDSDIILVQLWIIRLLKLCKKWNIVLRVLEGTPSHDRKQSLHFEHLNKAAGINCDVKYFSELAIEYIECFEINVLYVPDEWRATTKETENMVLALLYEHKLDKVDYAIMHGSFAHQLPNIAHVPIHDAEFYLSIVTRYIFIGHIHLMSRYDRILAQGSHDCLRHNEESDKGHFMVIAEDNPEMDKVIFVKTETPAIFLTVNICNMTSDEVELKLNDILSTINKDVPTAIRVLCDKNDSNEALVQSFKRMYSHIKWDIDKVKDKKKATNIIPIIFKPTVINSNTIIGIMKDRLERTSLSAASVDNVLKELHKIKSSI